MRSTVISVVSVLSLSLALAPESFASRRTRTAGGLRAGGGLRTLRAPRPAPPPSSTNTFPEGGTELFEVRSSMLLTNAEPVIIELTRGVEGKLVIVNENGERPPGCWLFLLEDAQLPLFRGPFPEAGGPSNYSFNRYHLWLGDRGLLNQRFQPDDRGRAHVPGLAPGRYTLRAVPDDLLFEPETFVISGEESEPIEIRWRPR